MYLLYADESGDTGLNNSPSNYFALSGLVVHELKWQETFDKILEFRKGLKAKYGLKLREEIHCKDMIHSPGNLQRIAKSLRLKILKEVLEFQATLPDINIINVIVHKTPKANNYNVFESAWETC